MRWGIASIAIIIVAFATAARAALPVTIDDLKRVFPGVSAYDHNLQPVDHYLLKDKSGEVIGVAFLASAIEPEVKGYVGEFDVLVGMDLKGTVTGAEILHYTDVPEYVERIKSSGFLKKFEGRTIERGFDDIDAVTGATVSSNAIKNDIQTAAFEIHKKLIHSGVVTKGEWITHSPFEILGLVAVVILCIGAVIAALKPAKRWIAFVLWTLSFFITGVWLNTQITIGTFVYLSHLVLPAFVPVLVLLVFSVIAVLVKGNLYCAYLCPFGAIQEGLARLGLPKLRPDASVVRNLAWLRWIVLIITIFGIAVGVQAFLVIEPFATCFSRIFSTVIVAQTGTVLVVALFFKRPWCRCFCPTGAVLDLFAQVGRSVRGTFKKKTERCDEIPTP